MAVNAHRFLPLLVSSFVSSPVGGTSHTRLVVTSVICHSRKKRKTRLRPPFPSVPSFLASPSSRSHPSSLLEGVSKL
ncbi:hypothetical protein BGZ63DRAFT_98057 [Mariannaea sp. PMI_226]|nr:hypothetical protein BGZ63DRAFT_98057 [Mariannaea sp. PMI_226]